MLQEIELCRPAQLHPCVVLICLLHLFAGRRREMDAYVDDLFHPVLDQGPPVSHVRRYFIISNVTVLNVNVMLRTSQV